MKNSKKHDFGAGPCILPDPILLRAAKAVSYGGRAGLSIFEITHRSPEFEEVMAETKRLIPELLHVPDSLGTRLKMTPSFLF